MVISLHNKRLRQCGSMMAEMMVAIAILMLVIVPVAYSFDAEKRAARATYDHAVAMEIVDGEMEVLAAGGWRVWTNGTMDYPVHALAATNLPPGKFILTSTPEKLRLEWRPAGKDHGGNVVREVKK
jgi:hypothetical protein